MPDVATTTLNANADGHAEQSPFPTPSNRYSCTLCHVSFCNNQEQRVHMKEPWQYVEYQFFLFTNMILRIDISSAYTTSKGGLPPYPQSPSMHSKAISRSRMTSTSHLSAPLTRKVPTTLGTNTPHHPSTASSAPQISQTPTPVSPRMSNTCTQRMDSQYRLQIS